MPVERNSYAAGSSFLKNLTFLVGFKGGINFSAVIPTQRFSVLQPINGPGASDVEKNYAPFYRNLGYQYGFIGMLRISRSLSLSIEPTFSSYSYNYSNGSKWYDASDQSDRIEITTDFKDKLKYFEIPLVLRYEFGKGQIRPYLAAGFFYGMQTGASATIKSTTVQYIDDTAIAREDEESAGDISGNYINTRLATFPGAGLLIDLSFVTLFAEADYFISLHNVVNESARYSNQQSVGGAYSVPDNLKFDNLVINVGVLFNINRKEQGGGQGGGKGSAVACPVVKRKR
jgi:hypothetical protein